jgi:hypothetical protein
MQLHGKSILDMGCLREGWDLLPKWHCTPEREVYPPNEGGSPKKKTVTDKDWNFTKKTVTDKDWNFTKIVCGSLCPRRQVNKPQETKILHVKNTNLSRTKSTKENITGNYSYRQQQPELKKGHTMNEVFTQQQSNPLFEYVGLWAI